MSGVYIHIPFCRQACIYCNFYFLKGDARSAILTDALLREIDLRIHTPPPFDLETVYFGGGTPSFIDPGLVASLIKKIKSVFPGSTPLEITLEANPDDMTREKLEQWKDMGITRFSVGVQSFFDHHLKWMNRAHNAAEAEHALKMAGEMGFELSADLIFGVPGSTIGEWSQNLEKMLDYNISHLSCYGLTLEDNTPWKKLITTGKYAGPEDAGAAEQFMYTMDFMGRQGWEHYEISNYCKPGFRARHNTSYWQDKPYIGIGPSAHSYDGLVRSWNVSDMQAYTEAILSGNVPSESELLGPDEKINEYLMTGLRVIWGVNEDRIRELSGKAGEIIAQLQAYVREGKVIQEGRTYRLSPAGKLYADAIAASLFV